MYGRIVGLFIVYLINSYLGFKMSLWLKLGEQGKDWE